MTKKQTDSVSRRRFLKAAAGTAAVTAGVAPGILGAAAREFKVGLIGCGGRGTGAARNAMSAGKMQGDDVVIHAVADLFSDKATRARRTFKVDESRMFVGFDAYKSLLETDCDYVILATPPHFRPAHLEAAVAAGKHVFTEKPVAVDPPGIRQFLAAGASAGDKGLSIAAGTQRRHEKRYNECAKRVAHGAIGDIVAGRCYWNMGGLWSVKPNPDWTDMEWQIRDWLYFTWLSGDHIVEQHVHNLDVVNWFIGRHPKTARGMGGRQVRTGKIEYGQIFDHFATELIYDNPKGPGHPDIRVSSMCRQIAGCWNDVSEFLVGTKGSTNCRDRIYGAGPWDEADWRWRGRQVDPYVQEHIDLQSSIKEDNGALNEAENVAHSTMTAILARTSCYTGREVHWDDLIQNEERIGPAKYEFGPLEIPPVPQVGKPM